MPRYYKNHASGYDLDQERAFCVVDGKRIAVGTAGSLIYACMTCGREHFRLQTSQYETCFKGHGQMELVDIDDEKQRSKLHALWLAQGDGVTTVEARREMRLKEEAYRPWNWVFGTKTEADFPLGYVKEC